MHSQAIREHLSRTRRLFSYLDCRKNARVGRTTTYGKQPKDGKKLGARAQDSPLGRVLGHPRACRIQELMRSGRFPPQTRKQSERGDIGGTHTPACLPEPTGAHLLARALTPRLGAIIRGAPRFAFCTYLSERTNDNKNNNFRTCTCSSNRFRC
jgi:hypothetical protein